MRDSFSCYRDRKGKSGALFKSREQTGAGWFFMDPNACKEKPKLLKFLRTRNLLSLFFMGGFLLTVLLLSGCSVGYLFHLGEGQLKIICGRKPVEKMLRSGELSPEQEEKVLVVLEAKTFGEKILGLTSSKNYTDFYEVKNPPVAYNLTASPRLALEAYRWCFPIVGCVPYKGFFERKRALRSEERMAEKGYDTYLRPVTAYSTLGWFKDPIFSTLLRYSEATLVEIILHEMVHRTIFLKNQVVFNEGIATFIGRKGALQFFQRREGQKTEILQVLEEKWEEEGRFGARMKVLSERLRTLYASSRPDAEKMKKRVELFEKEKTSFRKSLGPSRESAFSRILNLDWNNAFLISYLTYHKDLALWEEVYLQFQGDLGAMVMWLKDLDGEQDALSKSRLWLDERNGNEKEVN